MATLVIPGNPQLMQGLLGLSDQQWALVFFFMGIVLGLILGLLELRAWVTHLLSIILGLMTGGLVWFALQQEGGLGPFAGFLVLPVLCKLSALLGQAIARWFRGHKRAREQTP